MGFETRIKVSLYGEHVGTISVRGSASSFKFHAGYLESPDRAVLGLRFEENLRGSWTGHNRLPSWFSNLLPEGRLRQLLEVALAFSDSGTNELSGELKLIEAVGSDLSGAVELQVLDQDGSPYDEDEGSRDERPELLELPDSLRFSVAGLGLKFSMLREGSQFVAPAARSSGDWIVKFPDRQFDHLPRNEFAVMSFARQIGIETPEIELISRDQVVGLDDAVWGDESEAYAIKRFDRVAGMKVHTEDLAQVRGYYPKGKYTGTYETVANLFYRGRDLRSLQEFVRRLVFSVIIGNSDAHLKNWALVYTDRRVPKISPAYDLVSASPYPPQLLTRDLALKFGGSRDAIGLSNSGLARLERKLGIEAGALQEIAIETAINMDKGWADGFPVLDLFPKMKHSIEEQIRESVPRFSA